MSFDKNINLDMTTLRLFVKVAQLKSISRAAEALSIVPGAASRRMKLFEAHFGKALLARRSHGVVLTDTGTRALAYVQRILSEAETMFAALAVGAEDGPTVVRIACSSSAVPQFLARDLSSAKEALKGIDIEIIERHSKDVVKMVLDNDAELGIYESGHRNSALHVASYRHDELILLAHRKHKLAERSALSAKEILAEKLVFMEEDTAISVLLYRQAENVGLVPSVHYRVRNFNSMVAMINATESAGVLPRAVADLIETEQALKRVKIDENWAMRTFEICCSQEKAVSPPIEKILGLLRPA